MSHVIPHRCSRSGIKMASQTDDIPTCFICLEPLCDPFYIFSCCAQCVHLKCSIRPMFEESVSGCPHCRQPILSSDKKRCRTEAARNDIHVPKRATRILQPEREDEMPIELIVPMWLTLLCCPRAFDEHDRRMHWWPSNQTDGCWSCLTCGQDVDFTTVRVLLQHGAQTDCHRCGCVRAFGIDFNFLDSVRAGYHCCVSRNSMNQTPILDTDCPLQLDSDIADVASQLAACSNSRGYPPHGSALKRTPSNFPPHQSGVARFPPPHSSPLPSFLPPSASAPPAALFRLPPLLGVSTSIASCCFLLLPLPAALFRLGPSGGFYFYSRVILGPHKAFFEFLESYLLGSRLPLSDHNFMLLIFFDS